MEKNIVKHDFKYYTRTIEKAYKDYYQKILIILSALVLIEVSVIAVGSSKAINGGIIVLLLGISGFIITQYRKIDSFIEEEMKLEKISEFMEDSNYYYVKDENLKFSKKNSRNLTSQKRGITFFVGIQPFNVLKPV